MYMLVNALIVALLLPATTHKVQDGPACKAELTGLKLVTVVELPTGMRVEGPWKVMHSGEMKEGEAHYEMFAELTKVVHRDVLTGESREITLPAPVQLTFEGESQKDLVYRAAQVWCVTVMRAQENRALDQLSPSQPRATRIATLPRLSRGA